MAKRRAGDVDGDVPIAVAKCKADDINMPLRLTRKNLALLNSLNGDNNNGKDNGKDNGNKDNGSSNYFDSDKRSDTMTISTTASEFQRKAYENGILVPAASNPRQDLSTIRHRLAQRRTSTQPSEHTH